MKLSVRFSVFLVAAFLVGSSGFSQELPVRIGDSRETLLSKMGYPEKTKRFESGKERLFYDDLMVDVVDGAVQAFRSTKGWKGLLFSVRMGDTPEQVERAMGRPDERSADSLLYYDHEGMYVAFSLDRKKGVVRSFQVREGVTREAMEKKKAMIDNLVAQGVIASDGDRAAAREQDSTPGKPVSQEAAQAPSDEGRKDMFKQRAAHQYATERDYKKHRKEARRLGREEETLRGRLADKDPRFWPVEEKHGLPDRMRKFVIEYTGRKDGSAVKKRQECFVDRFSPYLVKKLDAFNEGDTMTVQGRWTLFETKERDEVKDVEVEQHFQVTIFVVDRIED